MWWPAPCGVTPAPDSKGKICWLMTIPVGERRFDRFPASKIEALGLRGALYK